LGEQYERGIQGGRTMIQSPEEKHYGLSKSDGESKEGG
jgi:hypothetical protein